MGEALVNHYLGGLGIKAYSSGVAPSGQVNLNALKALETEGISTSGLRSKNLAALEHKRVMSMRLIGIFFGTVTLGIICIGYLFNAIL